MALQSTLSRLEARCLLEAALESRNPRLLARKPTGGGLPIDLYALHQTVLRFGGYRKVSHRRTNIVRSHISRTPPVRATPSHD
jgi:hypothetical protein